MNAQKIHQKSLGDRSRESLGWKLASTFSQHGLGLISSLFLARLLVPGDFGLVAMALGVINIFRLIISFGHFSALIQDAKTSNATYSSVFFLNLILGILLCVLFQFSAPLVADFYSDSRMIDLTRVLSLSLVFHSLSLVHQAKWAKEMKFKKIAIQDMAAEFVGFTVGLITAVRGYGVYALVFQNLTAAISRTFICWLQSDWHPQFIFSSSEIKRLLPVGGSVFFSQSSDIIIKRLSIVVVGKFFGAATLGLFSRADSLSNLIVTYTGQSLRSVAFPYLSVIQNNSSQSRIALCRFLHIITFLSFGFVTVLFLQGEEIIRILFGQKWMAATAIFQFLVLQAPVFSSDQLISFAFLAKGRSRDYLFFDIFKKIILLIPLVLAFKYSFYFLLSAMLVAAFVVWILNHCWVLGHLGISKIERLKIGLPYVLIAMVSGKLALLLFSSFSSLLVGAYAGAFYLLANILVKSEGLKLSLKELRLIGRNRRHNC